MFKRVFRITFKLGLIVAIGVGVAVVVKKLTAPPEPPVALEPWPPLATDTAAETAGSASSTASTAPSNGEGATTAEEAAPSTN